MTRPVVYSASGSALGVTLTLTNEVAVFTSPAVTTSSPGANVTFSGIVRGTTGAGATGVTVRVRRGTAVTSPLVVEIPVAVGASANFAIPFAFKDRVGEVDGQKYVVTAQQVAATGNGSVDTVAITLIAE